MRRIIVNADDFGRHELINQAVAQGVAYGCLRSASVMPGGAAFAGAIDLAKHCLELGVGIHLTLVNGNPILPEAQIPSLVDAEGKFLNDYVHFVKKYFQGRVNREEVKLELRAQLDKSLATGLKFTHVDSHQHLHVLPGIIDLVLDLAAEAGIKAVRIPKTPLFAGDVLSTGPLQFIGRSGLTGLARLAEAKARNRGFKVPEHFDGIVAGAAVNGRHFMESLQHLERGTTEFMLHLGTDNEVLCKDCRWEHDFEAELQAVTAPAALALLKSEKIIIGSFADL